MAVTFNQSVGSYATLMSSGSSSLLSNADATGDTLYDNSVSSSFLYGDFRLNVTFGTAPTAGKTVDLYLLAALDGTVYPDANSSTRPVSLYVGSFVVRGVNTAQVIDLYNVPLPPTKFKAYVSNQTDQNMNSAWTLKMLPFTVVGN